MNRASANVNLMIKAARFAAKRLLRDFGEVENLQVSQKSPSDFVSRADRKAEESIKTDLTEGRPNYGWLGEESGASKGTDPTRRWIVDPLDGTKEFVKRNGEFTVNIALIHNGNPIMGVIYVPVKEELYFAMEGLGSYKIKQSEAIDSLDKLIESADKLPIDCKRENYVIVGSRSHMSTETEVFFEEMKKEHGNVEVMAVGSSLKFCMVSEGKADAYPRYAPTMEWDTGAGHAIAKYAGFSIKQYNSSEDIVYNKEDLLNPWLLVK